MAFVARRFFSTSSRAVLRNYRPSVATPAPFTQNAVLDTPELQQLAQKAAGPWKSLEKSEVVQCKATDLPRVRLETYSFRDGVLF